LWIGAARDGLKQTIKRSPRILARAFAPQSVVIYAMGFVIFAVVPYFLIVPRTPVSSAWWLDAGLLVARLLLAVLFSLIGWVVTVGALGERSEASGAVSIAQPSEGAGHVPAQA
jgi:cytochrome bd-type quinol oxidase subunit 1